MKYLKSLYVLIGLALLIAVVSEIDVGQVWGIASEIGWGLVVVLGLYFAAFALDSFTWQMTLVSVPLDGRWLYRAWKVRMVGEVFNSLVPAAGMGGEPVKAVLLKKYYGVGYRQATASLILAKTINTIALVIFLTVGFALMLSSALVPPPYQVVTGLGLLALAVGIFLFFVVQRLKVSSAAGGWISRWRLAGRIEGVMHHIRDMDERLVHFYTRHRGRFAVAVGLALVNWMIGVLEIYYTMIFLGHPISLVEAWIVEAAAQLVRAGTFFIPAHIGAQEGAFLLTYSALTGSPELGVAVALVRRFRETLWLLWGVALGAMFTLRPAFAAGGGGQGDDTAARR